MLDTTQPEQTAVGGDVWPSLPYAAWKNTLDTLHMWTQVVGKTKLEVAPFLNEWWEVGFPVTARGLTTGIIPYGNRVFQIDFDFLDHRLDIYVSDGSRRSLPLRPQSVADFYQAFMAALAELRMQVQISTTPVEVDDAIPFEQDRVHADYDPAYVHRWWRILVQASRLLEAYRTPFVGKSSPVLFWWGSFDLCETRFSGRPAPEREWPARWMALAADQEAATCGFWPGNAKLPEPAFFAYTFPEPPGCREAVIQPDAAAYHLDLSEFVLPYEAVRAAPDPDQLIRDFFQSTYIVGANLGGWDRTALERPDPFAQRNGASR